jgi:hypothetical protein
LNKGLSAGLKIRIKSFPSIKPVDRPSVPESIINPYWIAGFTSGEGCFRIHTYKNEKRTLGQTISLEFIVTQHSRDSKLLQSIADFFECGNFNPYADKTKLAGEFRVTSIKPILEKIIPFFQTYPIIGVKSEDFASWCEAAEIIRTAAHLRKEGFDKLIALKGGMNKSRKVDLQEDVESKSIEGPFYIYNRIQTILYYHTDNYQELTETLKIQKHYLLMCLDKGTIYYSKYTFSRDLNPTAKHQLLTLSELKSDIEKVRAKRK